MKIDEFKSLKRRDEFRILCALQVTHARTEEEKTPVTTACPQVRRERVKPVPVTVGDFGVSHACLLHHDTR